MQPYQNIRVIDLTHVIAGPFCTYQLAVMGADVIKVEPPESPDMSRANSSSLPGAAPGLGADFNAQNANKRAIAVDLKSEAGRDVLRRLIKGADVFVENYRSGALAAIGLGYDDVRAIKPDIIYCSLTGFGQTGPNAKRTAYDNVIQAYSGLMAATGGEDTAPTKVGPPVLDYGSGIQAAFAIGAALYQRAMSGDGQYIDVAMLDATLMLMSSQVACVGQLGNAPPLGGNGGNNSISNAGYCCYPTADGLLMLGAYTAKQRRDMWRVLGAPEYVDSAPKSGALQPADAPGLDDDVREITRLLAGRTAAEWEAAFNDGHVPAARVRHLTETLEDVQLQGRAVLQAAPGDDGRGADAMPGRFPVAGFTYASDGPALTRRPPKLGEHTREVLSAAGYDEDALRGLAADGVIAMAE